MFRNNYDNDSVTFSPQGRIFQVEYAAEARNAEELSSYQKKLFAIDEHVGLAIAGLTSDARVLSNFMKQQCLSQRLTYDRAMPVGSLVALIGDKAQTNTQHYGKRPYGVGLLVAGVDAAGPHLFEFQPSGLTQEMVACAIGARSQMARTYLEKNAESFASCGREELVRHGLRALKETLVQDRELTVENTSVGVVGINEAASSGKQGSLEFFKVYDGAEVKDWINSVGDEAEAAADTAAETGTTTEGGAAGGDGMQVDE
ncbi:Proteasome subunit alpha type-6 [Diatrype stigma]|uniref:Proteasome subunit alpha type n=1 Tax=Diatrype stigma TaxID=117547 RepID=A0AAN9YQQ1_9PEZI